MDPSLFTLDSALALLALTTLEIVLGQVGEERDERQD